MDGPHVGIDPANLPVAAVGLIVDADGNARPEVLEWLRTRASFRDVADALEAVEVSASWRAARRRNMHEHAAAKRAARE